MKIEYDTECMVAPEQMAAIFVISVLGKCFEKLPIKLVYVMWKMKSISSLQASRKYDWKLFCNWMPVFQAIFNHTIFFSF